MHTIIHTHIHTNMHARIHTSIPTCVIRSRSSSDKDMTIWCLCFLTCESPLNYSRSKTACCEHWVITWHSAILRLSHCCSCWGSFFRFRWKNRIHVFRQRRIRFRWAAEQFRKSDCRVHFRWASRKKKRCFSSRHQYDGRREAGVIRWALCGAVLPVELWGDLVQWHDPSTPGFGDMQFKIELPTLSRTKPTQRLPNSSRLQQGNAWL